MKILLQTISICFLCLTAFGNWGNAQIVSRKISNIEYLGNYPKNKKGNWTDNLQGISNNKDYWFFTQLTKLWKVPIGLDLRKSKILLSGKVGVTMVKMPSVLANKGYNHFGDPDNWEGFIFIPIEDEAAKLEPVIGVFKESDLKFIGYQLLKGKSRSGWCAIHPITKNLYTSHHEITAKRPIDVYQIDWSALKRTARFKLKFKQTFPLSNLPSSWKGKIATYLQGGDFSDDGQYLFLLNGRLNYTTNNKGISVFKVIEQSQGQYLFSSKQKGEFKYQFSPKILKSQEPEGLTFANLKSNKRIKFKGGQLHAILLNKKIRGDAIYIKHYKITYK